MDNLLSIVTFIPALAALILALFLRGDDEAAARNAKWVALIATVDHILGVALSSCQALTLRDTAFRWWKSANG